MGSLTLLARARDAGLTVVGEGDRLVIRGPRRAEPVVLELIEHKAEVLAALADRPTFGPLAGQRWGPSLEHDLPSSVVERPAPPPDPLDRLEYQGRSPEGTHVWSDPDEPTLAEFDAAVPMAADWFLTPENIDRHRGDSPS